MCVYTLLGDRRVFIVSHVCTSASYYYYPLTKNFRFHFGVASFGSFMNNWSNIVSHSFIVDS